MKKYFLEFKARIFLTFLSWLAVIIIGYLYKKTLLFLILQSYRATNIEINPSYFIFTGVTEIFSVYMNLIVWLSSQILFLQVAYHFFNFLSFALFKLERDVLKKLLQIAFSIFVISVWVSNYFIIPLTWNFFLSFQGFTLDSFISLHFEARLIEYLNFYISIYNTCIVYFQIFTIFMFFISYVNASVYLIKSFRKLYYYIFVIFSTLVSPPDVVSQIFISLLLVSMYELLVFFFVFKRLLIGQEVKAYKNTHCKN